MDKLKYILSGLILLLTIISSGCKKAPDEPDLALTTQDYLNVSYGPHAMNALDIYLPEERKTTTPVILLVHGGSWFEGDKSAFTDLAKYWRNKGYVAATINYRLTNTPEKDVHPAQVNDIAKAIEFISSKAAEWKCSTDKFALQGASAGAHLSLLYTYKYNTNGKVKAVISMAGPTDLTAMGASPAVQWLIGSGIHDNPGAYVQASPITHVLASSKPTLLFHGKKDDVVSYQQSVILSNRLKQVGVAEKFVLYEDTGHEVINVNYMASFLADCENWFKLYLK